MSADRKQPPLTAASYVTLVLFIAVSIFALRPLRCLLTLRGRTWTISLSLATAPLLAVIISLAAQVLILEGVHRGILGTPGGVEPYMALALVLSLAYLCTALDQSGALEKLSWIVAHHVIRSKRSGRYTLFAAHFFLCAGLTALFSNDAVVMTLTPVVAPMAHAMQV